MNDGSWFKIYRKILSWKWFQDSKTLHVFLFLLARANIKTSFINGKTIKRGQVVTSYASIAEATGMSVSSARRAIENLVSTGEIKTKTTNQFSVITITKYETYQEKYADFEQPNEQAAEQADEQADEQHHKKNKKKVEEKKPKEPPKETAYLPQYWERDIPEKYHGKFQTEDDWWEFVNQNKAEVEAAYEL